MQPRTMLFSRRVKKPTVTFAINISQITAGDGPRSFLLTHLVPDPTPDDVYSTAMATNKYTQIQCR